MNRYVGFIFIFSLIAALLFVTESQGQTGVIHYVSHTGSHSRPFTTWATAATDIQSAVDVAGAGDTVLITNGTYIPGSSITVTNGIYLKSVNGAAVTKVDGNKTIRCFNLLGPEIVVDRLTIQHGLAPTAGGVYLYNGGQLKDCILLSNKAEGGPSVPGYSGYGGGIYLESGGKMSGCLIQSNYASVGYGGGVYVKGWAMISNCTIRRNTADNGGNHPLGGHGGGIYCTTSCTIRQCLIENNWAGSGGGIVCRDGWIEGCLIRSNITSFGYYNQSARGGGILLNPGDHSLVENCLIVGNKGGKYAGGINGSSNSVVRNCTIVNNIAEYGSGGGVQNADVRNCIIWGNTAYEGETTNYMGGTLQYTDTTPLPTGEGNISTDPGFANPSNGNFRLSASSPCIDTASSSNAPDVDIDGVPRPLDGNNDGVAAFDMGAYEFVHATADSDQDGLSDWHEINTYGCSPIHKDTDQDGQNDNGEVIAGTDPTDSANYFSASAVPGGEVELSISWYGRTNRTYDVYRCDELLESGNGFEPVDSLTNIVFSEDGVTSVMDSASSNFDIRFYRVRVKMQ